MPLPFHRLPERRFAACVVAGGLLALLAGCGPKVTYLGSAGEFPERPGGCTYRVLSGWSAQPFFVVGRFDLAAFHRGRLPGDEKALRRALGDRVCAVGGDAVIAYPDTTDRYVQAVVVAFLRIPSGTETPDPPPPPPGGQPE